ncbi:4a-hydroxytetrahydrobiopterin dehydratase [Flexivirga alba]|uniref:Putative pterin-4-alpha-carbinolamine dehydratase n=1 Tax=Flexivirga alba TaxID=702742 RepID=A0ABW2AFM8_9MICO
MSRLLTDEEITRQLAALDGWSRDGDTLRSAYTATSFARAIEFVHLVAADADHMNHHPDIEISYTAVRWALSTHSEGASRSSISSWRTGSAKSRSRPGRRCPGDVLRRAARR